MRDDPGKFAVSKNGTGEDSENAVELANLLDARLSGLGSDSISGLYQRFTAETTQGAAVARAVANGFRVFQQTLEGQQLAISGVSLAGHRETTRRG